MRRRTLLSASLGLGALLGAAPIVNSSTRLGAGALGGLTLYSGSGLAFGTTVTIKVLHDDAQAADSAIQYALQQVRLVDALMSLHQERSQIFQLNRRGSLQAPDKHVLHVLAFSQQLAKLTAGAFDITVQPLWDLFSRAHAQGNLPTPEQIAAAKPLVDWRQLDVNRQQVRLRGAGTAITLNGVAQGYAVDLAIDALRDRGVRHALLDTGEFGAMGRKSGDQHWALGIGNPRQHEAISAVVSMDGRKVATSGDYATFFSPDYRHHHIFDPATGDSPVELASVTVVAPTGLLADGLSTAFMVMGAEKSFALAVRMPNVDALLIDKGGALRKTSGFPELQT